MRLKVWASGLGLAIVLTGFVACGGDDDPTGAPTAYGQTLNAYGLAYKTAGRDADAIEAIDDLETMPVYEEFLLSSSHKQQFDDYALYRGLRVRHLLTEVDVDLNGITGVPLISADGFMKDFSADAVLNPFPDGVYYSGLGPDTKGGTCRCG